MKRFKYLTLAALVAFGACDEADEIIVPVVVTGTISGVVTIEGTGAAGVTVTLSSGSTATTDGAGTYAFSGVAAGAYTVSISGFASDAAFASSAKAATISTAGQVATVNFDGSFVRTSAIIGSVAAGGVGLSGVTVSIGSSSTATDANGQYAFSGLRAGSYTVAISGFSASTYTFATTSMTVTLAVGESKVASFSGALLTTASITGTLFLDENDKDNTYTAGLEDALAAANITVTIEGGAVNNTWTTQTAADGTYSFADLGAGTYRVTLDLTDVDIPANVAFGGTNAVIVTVATGGTATVNFPFDIMAQAVIAYAFLGTDIDVSATPGPGHAPLAGVVLNLYDTQGNATLAGATGRLDQETTDANGMVEFSYLRANDDSPGGGPDEIVFAAVSSMPTNFVGNGEGIIEIAFNPKNASVMAADTFDALNGAVVLKYDATDVRGNVLAGWNFRTFVQHADTLTGTTHSFGVLAADGSMILADVANPALFPVTYYFDLAGAQALANGHGFAQTASADRGTTTGSYVTYVQNGLTLTTDTIYVGRQTVNFTDANIQVRVHDEEDDSTDAASYTGGDALPAASDVTIELYDSTGTSIMGPFGTFAATGEVLFSNVPVGKTYTVRARSANVVLDMLNDTIQTIVLDGAVQADTMAAMAGNAGYSTFAVKHNDAGIGGFVRAADATQANGIVVKITATSDNIQPLKAADTTVVVSGGAYFVGGMREGPYMVQVFDSIEADGDSIWAFLATASTTTDMTGAAAAPIVNFTATRMDTKIQGVVVNDRDSDFNTLDPDEALAGVTINLIDDTNKDGVVDATETTVLATATTDASGAYSFTKLREGFYHVEAISPANATVLRALSGTGAVTKTASVNTMAAVGAGATLNQSGTRQAGNMAPPVQNDEFPRWNYLTGAASADAGNLAAGAGPNATNGALTTAPTHFVHLFNTGTAAGQIVSAAPLGVTAGVGATGVRVTITRCQTAAAQPSPPAAGACTAKHGLPSPHIQNVDTDASGNYSFAGLLEGVYQIDVAPATGGYTTNEGPDDTPASGDEIILVTIKGDGDVETVADYVIS